MGELNYAQYSKSNRMFSMPYHAEKNNNAWESNINWAGQY